MQPDLSLGELVSELAARRGLDLRGYKHGTLQRRLRRRLRQVGIESYSEYLRHVLEDPGEISELLNAVLINVTEFFRDPPAWEFLRTSVLPNMLREVGSGEIFRAWCVGCATGEEPYSLAMLLADYFGDQLPERDVKVYATDIDEEALTMARRAEYVQTELRRVRPAWRQKYFSGSGRTVRITHDVRRLVIFGRSNILSDAPISHCNLIICRNLLIYFNSESQQHIFKRLHYALEPSGVLFLGKAESKLNDSPVFRAVNSRWRIFQKISETRAGGAREGSMADRSDMSQDELRRKELEQRHILDSLNSGVILLDNSDVVTNHNAGALQIWAVDGTLSGQRIQSSEIGGRCPDLAHHLETAHRTQAPVRLECWVKPPDGTDGRLISISLHPMLDGSRRLGTLMHCEDVTPHEKLRTTVEQLESTTEELQSSNEELETANEELQSTNEELETTNEELQSTNEELETTNEELQSTNEELETANEELQSLNEELENMNEELEHRTRELNQSTERYAETLRSMPFPVLLVDGEGKIQLWNAAAQKISGVSSTSVVGVELNQLPVDRKLLDALVRRCRTVMDTRRPAVLNGQAVKTGSAHSFDLHFAPVSRSEAGIEGVLVIFGPSKAAPATRSTGRSSQRTTRRADKSPGKRQSRRKRH